MNFIQEAEQYGQALEIKKRSPWSLSGICEYWFCMAGALTKREQVDRLIQKASYGVLNSDLFHYVDHTVLRRFGVYSSMNANLSFLPMMQRIWCREGEGQTKEIVKEIGEALLQKKVYLDGTLYVSAKQRETAFLSKAQGFDQRISGLVANEISAKEVLLYKESQKFEIVENLWRRFTDDPEKMTPYFREILEECGEGQRKQMYVVVDQFPSSKEVIRREMRMDTVRRSIRMSIDPTFRALEMKRSDHEKVEEISLYAWIGLTAYAALTDIVSVFEEFSPNTSLKEFVSKWVGVHKDLPGYDQVQERVHALCRQLDIPTQKAPRELPRKGAATYTGTLCDIGNVLSGEYTNSKKRLLEVLSNDLFALSVQEFIQVNPLKPYIQGGFERWAQFLREVEDAIVYSILYIPSDRKTAQRSCKLWLRVASALYEKDASMCMTIIGVLSRSYLKKLVQNKDKEIAVVHYKEMFEDCLNLMDSSHNHKRYRDMERERSDYIPYPGLLSKDILFIRDAESNRGKGALPAIISMAGKQCDEIFEKQKRLKGKPAISMRTNISMLLKKAQTFLQKKEKDHEKRSQTLIQGG